MAASAMPVLPDDGSRMVWPGASRPSFSAASIIDRAIRSFTDPNGFWLSSLARMRARGLGLSALTSTSGVFPIMSSTFMKTGNPGLLKSRLRQSGMLPRQKADGLLPDLAVDDAVAAQDRCLVTQAHDHVVPVGVGGLGHVGGAGIGLGVGVAVHHADDLQAAGLGVAIGPEVLLRIDRVHPARSGHVLARVEHGALGPRRIPGELPAGLEVGAVVAVADGGGVHV